MHCWLLPLVTQRAAAQCMLQSFWHLARPDKALAGKWHAAIAPCMLQADAAYVMWNDEFPSGRVWRTGGHAKGVLGFGEQQGYWLLHSVSSQS
jgi:Deoxyribonuclease II